MRKTTPKSAAADWSTDAGHALDLPEQAAITAATPTARPAASVPRSTVKFTATLDGATEELFTRLTGDLVRQVGRIATRTDRDRVRSGYAPSRADLLRALLEVAQDDPAVMAEVSNKVRTRYLGTDVSTF